MYHDINEFCQLSWKFSCKIAKLEANSWKIDKFFDNSQNLAIHFYIELNLKEKSMVNFLENKWLIVLIEKNNSLGFNLDYSLTPSLSDK